MHLSKFAPKTPQESLRLSKAEKQKQAKRTATRLLGRLQWKAQSLVASFIRARDIVTQNGQEMRAELEYAFMLGTSSEQAEAMFKVDFFEFYTLMERYIVCCLEIVGVSVSSAPRTNVKALRYLTNPAMSPKPDAVHSFHANILEALDDTTCPLHASLGNQDVRIQLGHAKDYRNAWKDADDASGGTKETRRKLPDFDLHLMLTNILSGCVNAHSVVQNQVASEVSVNNTENYGMQMTLDSMENIQDAPLEYMDDAMDLDDD